MRDKSDETVHAVVVLMQALRTVEPRKVELRKLNVMGSIQMKK